MLGQYRELSQLTLGILGIGDIGKHGTVCSTTILVHQ